MNSQIRSALLAGAGVLLAHHTAAAGIVVDSSAAARVRFLNIQEHASGRSFGRDGVRFVVSTPRVWFAGDDPAGWEGVAGGAWDQPFGVYDGFLPREGDGWDSGASTTIRLDEAGHRSVINQAVLDLQFQNVSGGSSVYSMDVAIDWTLRYAVTRPDELHDTASLVAILGSYTSEGGRMSWLGGPQVIEDSTAPETFQSVSMLAHLEIGSTPENPYADLARLQVTFTLQAYGATSGGPLGVAPGAAFDDGGAIGIGGTPVPSPGGAALAGVAGALVLAARRRR